MFNQKLSGIFNIVLLAFLFSATASLRAEDAVQQKAQMVLPKVQAEYSAVNYMETGNVSFNQKIYYTPDRERRDMNSEGTEQVVIIRMDKKISWMLVPERKIYVEMNVPKGRIKMNDILAYYKIEQIPAGEDVIDGMKTIKSRIVMTEPRGKIFSGFMWTTIENIVVKIDTVSGENDPKDKLKIELKDLKIEKQDPKLFDIPEGFVKTIVLPLGNDSKTTNMMKSTGEENKK